MGCCRREEHQEEHSRVKHTRHAFHGRKGRDVLLGLEGMTQVGKVNVYQAMDVVLDMLVAFRQLLFS